MILPPEWQIEYDAHQVWISDHNEGKQLNWSDTELLGVDLRGANLSKANLSQAKLDGADLSWADLNHVM
jgi:uncharacterized protein YjbI with pentapeptide repeats